MEDESRVEALLAESGWIRSLARNLVRDSDEAEELTQEAWLAALHTPPKPDKPVRRWLAAVMRNFARQRRRRERVRTRPDDELESVVESPVTSEELVARQRLLVSAVEELEEPMRDVLLMQYFEGLSPRRIAETLGIPLKTVYSRHERALGKLRSELDRQSGGDRSHWTAAWLAILADEPRGPGSGRDEARSVDGRAPGTRTRSPLSVRAGVVGVAATALIAVAVLRIVLSSPEPSDPTTAGPATGFPASLPERLRGPRATRPPRPPRDGEELLGSASPDVPAATRGRVFLVDGTPLAGADVRVVQGLSGLQFDGVWFEPRSGGETRVATTDAEGVFEVALPPGRSRITLAPGAWTTVIGAHADSRLEGMEPVLVGALREPLAGVVVDQDGAPVRDAEVVAALAAGVSPELWTGVDEEGRDWNYDHVALHSARTDEAGRFELPDACRFPGLELRVTSAAHEPEALELDETVGSFIEVRLLPLAEESLIGRVLDPDGRPRAGALVSLDGGAPVTTDAEGLFEVEPARGRDLPRLVAVAGGRLPVSVTPELDASGAHVWPEPLELVFSAEPPPSLAGVVVDAQGAPLQRAHVAVYDPTPFASGEIPLPAELVIRFGTHRLREYFVATLTDDGGRFRIDSLLHRDYELGAVDPRTLAAGSVTARAGSNAVRIVVPTDRVQGPLRGRVLTRSGEPLGGALVSGSRVLFELRRSDHPRPLQMAVRLGEDVLTQADGSFALPPMARTGTLLRVRGMNRFAPHEHPLRGDEDRSSIEIRVPMLAEIRVEAASEGATHFELHDGEGLPLLLIDSGGPMVEPVYRARVQEPARRYHVTEIARTLVLLRDGVVLRSVPVTLEAGRLQLLP